MTNIADRHLDKMQSEPSPLLPLEKQQEFTTLFQEFRSTYLPTTAGHQQLELYARGRETARTNFALITAAAARRQNITDRVLLQLLPYTASQSNRQRGAWIHATPALTGDIRKWYETKRWTQPTDWPQIARAILHFFQRCDQDPTQLAAACTEFAQLPYTKGFQTGTLSPLLNAIHPENFALINNKSRRVLNYLTSSIVTQALTDYPAANAKLLTVVAELSARLEQEVTVNARLGDIFDLFCHWLVAIKKLTFRDVRDWSIALGENSWQWDEWREGGFVAIGWDELGDLTGMSRKDFVTLRDQLVRTHPEWSKRGIDQVWQFAHQLHEGDRIVATEGNNAVVGIGVVAGAYYFVPDVQNGHCLPVEWDETMPRKVDLGNRRKTLSQLEHQTFEAILQAPALEPVQSEPTSATPPLPLLRETRAAYQIQPSDEPVTPEDEFPSASMPVLNPLYPLSACAQDTSLDEATLRHWVNAIRRKGQAIIYGPPGTGKTFLADHLARHLLSGDDGFMEMVQFHPSYAYEDFVQGIRPRTVYGQLSYAMAPGRFLEFCRQAEQRQGACVLIIDEINRANLARVFGELMVLLEYRDKKIPLAGGDHWFSIPANVYLIGTMNTADRSIALVDHALRRRFAFLALYPNYDALRTFHARAQTDFPVEFLIHVLQRLNQQIGDRQYEIGISFFMRTHLGEEIADIWQMEIEPYLEEYFFDNLERMEEFRWARVAREMENRGFTG